MRVIIIIFLSFCLTACMPHSRDNEYLQAKSISPLKNLPKSLHADSKSYFEVPPHPQLLAKKISIVPPGL
jgi:hypothetical protein